MRIMTHNQVLIRYHENPAARGCIWYVHGFCCSGHLYENVFDSVLCDDFSIYLPDFPGFGASPPVIPPHTVADSALLLSDLVRKVTGDAPVFFLCHSLGGIVGTKAAKELGRSVRGCVSVEGNLTRQDAFLTGLSEGFDDAGAFYDHLAGIFLPLAQADPTQRRFTAGFLSADPDSVLAWGTSCAEATGETAAGDEFRTLSMPTLFVWGGKSLPEMSKEYIERYDMNHLAFPNAGHNVMVDEPEGFYRMARDFFLEYL
ncbi:MAG: alpha/beta hydrolase [Deltaproteobacteria bacterium]|nr:alpha/beta hydrolase [Candidatus Zymogenaceae bacterium]